MKIAVLKERRAGEPRVAATPDTVKKFVSAGHEVAVEADSGTLSGIRDGDFADAGAKICPDAKATLAGADLILKVRALMADEFELVTAGQAVAALMEPHGDVEQANRLAEAGIDAFAMEFVPRITRAQSMDALSSQSNLAGYRAVIEGAHLYGRAFPMMMTAAGTVAPAKVFVMGAGVAGLQAIATARRLGAVVSATDVRPASKEQVASLGAKFIAVEDEEFKAAETAGGYAKQMSPEYQAKQAELVASHIVKQDVVITTALIPGRPAPELVSEAMVRTMRPGSVIIDLAAAQGGNCKLARPDEVVDVDGVKIYGPTNLPAAIAADASALYAKNLLALSPLLVNEEGGYAPNWDDEIVQGAALTRDGKIIHPSLTGA
ncbi:MAG: NAD(P)(+) transhydrogenase (Re/Si-specific) subunit alpha [Hirschia sp.]|nr:NAD(P)(+) transhydrogenase (Re/Si-specific) subunit alpha [Hirschia sp.]MBF19165.1 NAD(P)(+) transhydrogenase (Re/Si-specific) subunit alpha [Hirschia sp.]